MKTTGNVLTAICGVLVCAGGLFLLKTVADPQGIMQALPFILIGIGCGAFGYGVGEAVKCRVLRKHPDLARQQQIESQDERNQAIDNIAKAKAFDLMIYVFAALLIAFALMGAEAKIIIPLVIGYLLIGFYRIYYQCRLAKKM